MPWISICKVWSPLVLKGSWCRYKACHAPASTLMGLRALPETSMLELRLGPAPVLPARLQRRVVDDHGRWRPVSAQVRAHGALSLP